MKTLHTMHAFFKKTDDGYLAIINFKGNRYANGAYTFRKVFKTQTEALRYAGNAIFQWEEMKKPDIPDDELHGRMLQSFRNFEQF